MSDYINASRKSAHETPINEVVRALNDGLGAKMLAAMTQVDSEEIVAGWINGEDLGPDAEARLRGIYEVFLILTSRDSVHTTRMWFVGTNPNLNYTAPALVIRDGRVNDAVAAAKTYSNNG